MKRLFDIVSSMLLLVILSPVMWSIALLIRLFDGKPVLFNQMRVGAGGKEFKLIKFRTMTNKAGSENGQFDAGSTARVTRFGQMLRQTKLDELPQLLNVLRGEMSLVGPRPEVREWVEVFPERWEKVLQIRPGITDPASVIYRNEEKILSESANPEQTYKEVILPHKLSLYEKYVDENNLRLDIHIILQTLKALIR